MSNLKFIIMKTCEKHSPKVTKELFVLSKQHLQSIRGGYITSPSKGKGDLD
jgi:hypothetical protein